MANEEHLAILRQGVEAWNRWRQENFDVRPLFKNANLVGADLRYMYLVSADFTGAHLEGANLAGADIGRSDLQDAHLNGADLSGGHFMETNLARADLHRANLTRINLYGANLAGAYLLAATIARGYLQAARLTGANLAGADLTTTYLGQVDFTNADLTGANLTHAELDGSNFGNNDLRHVQGLDKVRHQRQSFIGVETLVRSGGKIPEVFLRGCGVPDSIIEYLPSLIGAMEPIQYYSCFISYSTKDQDFTRRLHGRMQQEHLRVWFAPEDMKGGQKLHEQIDQAIRLYDKLVLVLSEQSIQSEWVMTEIHKARKSELKDKRRKLFPIRLVDMDTLREWECFDADIGKDLAVEVREYFIPDFTRWKDHDSFEREFAKLLDALKATEAPPIPRAVEAPRVSGDAKAGAQENQSIIEIKKRRLRLLEEQQARKGQDIEPHIVIEIEDLRQEIAEIEGK